MTTFCKSPAMPGLLQYSVAYQQNVKTCVGIILSDPPIRTCWKQKYTKGKPLKQWLENILRSPERASVIALRRGPEIALLISVRALHFFFFFFRRMKTLCEERTRQFAAPWLQISRADVLGNLDPLRHHRSPRLLPCLHRHFFFFLSFLRCDTDVKGQTEAEGGCLR